ncbi:unnamed protein product, partial [marine sediment metagenome]
FAKFTELDDTSILYADWVFPGSGSENVQENLGVGLITWVYYTI